MIQREELQKPTAEQHTILLHHATELKKHHRSSKEHANASQRVKFACRELRSVRIDGMNALLVDPLQEQEE